jgi:cell division septal protein FtsQ
MRRFATIIGRRKPGNAPQDHLRYMRRKGNRRVRARRFRRSALRATILVSLSVGAVIALFIVGLLAVRWVKSPGNLKLARLDIQGQHEGREEEIRDLVAPWMGKNLLSIDLLDLEESVRKHPWIGTGGQVRIQRRFPNGLRITVREREAAGLALVNGAVVLVDAQGAPIDRLGPRYAEYDFPIIVGLEGLVRAAHDKNAVRRSAAAARLSDAMRKGVEVVAALAAHEPAFYAQISEIDMSDPGMVGLVLEGESYTLRLSREDCLRNLHNYFALRPELASADDAVAYVDLRWENRVAVSPASALIEEDGGE